MNAFPRASRIPDWGFAWLPAPMLDASMPLRFMLAPSIAAGDGERGFFNRLHLAHQRAGRAVERQSDVAGAREIGHSPSPFFSLSVIGRIWRLGS